MAGQSSYLASHACVVFALHRLPFSELTEFEFCSTFPRTLYCVVFENRTEKLSIHAGSEHSVLMFYGFEGVWVFLAKTVRAKASQPMQGKKRKNRGIYPFSLEH
jgi:hypothetical protein